MRSHSFAPALRSLALFTWGAAGGLLVLAAPQSGAALLGAMVLGALSAGLWVGARLRREARAVVLGTPLVGAVGLTALGPGSAGLVLAALVVGVAVAAVPGPPGRSIGAAFWVGAATSALLGAQVMLPAVGAHSLWRAAAFLLAVGGALAWRALAGAQDQAVAPPPRRRADPLVAALAGAGAALGWRAAMLMIAEASHASVYAVPLAATGGLLGAAVGARWRSRRPALSVEVLLAGLLAASWLASSVLVRAPRLVTALAALFRHAVEAWMPLQLASLVLWSTVAAGPGFFLAALLRAEPGRENAQRIPAGLGAAAGFAVTVLLVGRLLPNGLLMFGVLQVVAALGYSLAASRGRGVALGVAGLAGAVTVAQALSVRPTAQAADDRHVVSVSAEEGHHVLRINGRPVGSDGADLDWQILAPDLGLLGRADAPKRALVLGAGTGEPVHALLTFPLEQVDVAVPSTALRDAAANFGDSGRAAFADPRCHVLVGSPMEALTSGAGPWDVIVALPDAEQGLTVELLGLARRHLAPQGRFVQVLSTVDSNEHLTRLAFRTVRSEFPHGTTWLGPDMWALVASAEPQRWDLKSLEAQLTRPALAADLARLGLHAPTSLLMRQSQSDQGQGQWAGEGGLNSADRDLLRFGAPVAALVGTDATLPDERTGPERGRALELATATRDAPLTAEQLRDGLEHLGRAHLPNDPLLRGLAEAWLEKQPSPDAAVALARSGLAQGSPGAARRALAPLIAAGDRTAPVVTQWLVLRWAEQRRLGAPFNPVDVSDALALGREAVAKNPGDAELRAALSRLEAAQ